MSHYRFPGYTRFVHSAAEQIGHPEAEVGARRITILSALGNLCAQAGGADPEKVPAVMVKAAEFRDQLHAAYKAAELMLDEIHEALGLPVAEPESMKATSRPTRPSRPTSKKA